jgi:1-pyrroline-5-carboxylate dehydrogenase
MLAQSKTVYQAEIDAVCELCDFLRFNTYFMQQIFQVQPENFAATWNRLEYRPLEGFVFAVSPFNFTAIGGNLAMAPAVTDGVCVWRLSSTAVCSSHVVMRILREASLPDGVINFVPGDAAVIGEYTLKDRNLAGSHFTGSNAAFERTPRSSTAGCAMRAGATSSNRPSC